MPNDVEFKTFHELFKAAMRLPPLKIAVAMPRRSPSSTDRRRPPSKVFEVRSRGQVDLLLVPDLVSGNIFAKNLEYLAEATLGGVVLGAVVPIHSHLAGRSSEGSFGFRGYLQCVVP